MNDLIDTTVRDDMKLETLQAVAAESHAEELVCALASAVAGDPHWRHHAQELLRTIARGEVREPR